MAGERSQFEELLQCSCYYCSTDTGVVGARKVLHKTVLRKFTTNNDTDISGTATKTDSVCEYQK